MSVSAKPHPLAPYDNQSEEEKKNKRKKTCLDQYKACM